MRLIVPLFLFAFAALFSDASVKETVESTHAVDPGASFSLDNINGRVTIDTWDRAEIKIVALKKADDQEDLDAMDVKIQASPTHVSVWTKYNKKEDASFWNRWNSSGEVSYTVTVPVGTVLEEVKTVNGAVRVNGVEGSVHVSSVNGSVEAEGLRSDASISTVNGHLKAVFASINQNQRIKLNSVNGRSEIVVPANASFEIKARTVHGGISNDFGLDNGRSKWGVGSRMRGQLGEGGADVDISTVNGGIRVSKASGTM
jgi:DUF4097 and DUF4098 domain-containing protein YvlB